MEIREKHFLVRLCFSLLLFCAVALLSGMLVQWAKARHGRPLSENMDAFRAFTIDDSFLESCRNKGGYRELAAAFLYHGGKLRGNIGNCGKFSWYYHLLSEDISGEYEKAFAAAVEDGRCFPVAGDGNSDVAVSYEDSWGGERNYGGKRRHEGTDLMPSSGERGKIPIVSVSDGVVEKMGWLTLGGYRLGIRAPHGAYYYYAHLDHYENGLEEGSEVKAGEVIGYMGDSGYGKEGTVGKFAVHLHFGVYLPLGGGDVSINPYWILKELSRMGT